jgi:hypothetical protein
MGRTALIPTALCVALLSFSVAPSARAEAVQQTSVTNVETDQDRPSVFSQGYQGLLAGAVTGLAGGYLVTRRDGFAKREWRGIGLGIGIGALTGAALGISLGFVDAAGSPAGRYVARDLLAGAGFGAAIGAIGGGISAIAKDDAEHVLAGAAIGTVAGAGLGIITGVVQGALQGREARSTARLKWQPTLAVARGSALPGVAGTF